ncbi:MAG TPA: rhodanese-like domain-containing protein [Candidatus Dormibacteraeota bacterium]|nr:rhodanese-like domain-containing protein [Candidatus Dormibacteraeota bacterium]
MRKVLLEAAAVALVGAIIAFAANAVSPRGLKLNRDYFRGQTIEPIANPTPSPASGGTGTKSELETLAAQLKAEGLQLIDGARARELFDDARRRQDEIIFIDARNLEHYREGHIPGAYQFDYYHYEDYLAAIVPLCQKAQQIVVYCTGGKCEDSRLAAKLLGDIVSKEKLMVYGGGITEWTSKGLPVEKGEHTNAPATK